jgi:hypothetical protein
MKGALLTLAILALPAAASAKEYGSAGTIEVGGTFGFSSDTTDFDKGGKDTTTDMTISPSIGYFVIPGLEANIGVDIDNSTDKPEGGTKTTDTTFTPNLGAAYFVAAGPVKVGPAVQLSIINESNKASGTTIKRTGTGLGAGLLAKAPVSQGGVITAGLVFSQDSVTDKSGGASAKGTITRFGTIVGFSVFF